MKPLAPVAPLLQPMNLGLPRKQLEQWEGFCRVDGPAAVQHGSADPSAQFPSGIASMIAVSALTTL